MNLNEKSNVVLIETDNKVLSADLVNSIKKRFGKKTINKVLLIQPPDTDKKSFIIFSHRDSLGIGTLVLDRYF